MNDHRQCGGKLSATNENQRNNENTRIKNEGRRRKKGKADITKLFSGRNSTDIFTLTDPALIDCTFVYFYASEPSFFSSLFFIQNFLFLYLYPERILLDKLSTFHLHHFRNESSAFNSFLVLHAVVVAAFPVKEGFVLRASFISTVSIFKNEERKERKIRGKTEKRENYRPQICKSVRKVISRDLYLRISYCRIPAVGYLILQIRVPD